MTRDDPTKDATGRDELGTDLCLCGHLRDQHLDLPSGEVCTGLDDGCECDAFERDG